MEVITGPVAIISTIAMFGILGLLKFLLRKKKGIHANGYGQEDRDHYKFGGSLDFCDPNDPSSHRYDGNRPG